MSGRRGRLPDLSACLQDQLTFDSTYRPGNNFANCSLEPIEDGGEPAAGRTIVESDYTNNIARTLIELSGRHVRAGVPDQQ